MKTGVTRCGVAPVFQPAHTEVTSVRGHTSLGFTQPLPGFGGGGAIEVSDRRFRKWLTKYRHAVLPPRIPDHCKAFNIRKMFEVKLDIFP